MITNPSAINRAADAEAPLGFFMPIAAKVHWPSSDQDFATDDDLSCADGLFAEECLSKKMSFISDYMSEAEETKNDLDNVSSEKHMASAPAHYFRRPGRKPFNATGERDPATGKWIVDLFILRTNIASAPSGPVVALLRPGRKPWNATGKRDKITGKWELDLSLVKPRAVINKRKHTGVVENQARKRLSLSQRHSYSNESVLSEGDVNWTLEEADFFRVFDRVCNHA